MNAIKLKIFAYLCKKTKTNKVATQLWNWADHQKEPEAYWDILLHTCPWAFRSNHINSIDFTY